MYCKDNKGASCPRLGGVRAAVLQRLRPLLRPVGRGEALHDSETLSGRVGSKLGAATEKAASALACGHHRSHPAKQSAGWINSGQCMVVSLSAHGPRSSRAAGRIVGCLWWRCPVSKTKSFRTNSFCVSSSDRVAKAPPALLELLRVKHKIHIRQHPSI